MLYYVRRGVHVRHDVAADCFKAGIDTPRRVNPRFGGTLIDEGHGKLAKRGDQPDGNAALKLVKNSIVIAGSMRDPICSCGRVLRVQEVSHARYDSPEPRRGSARHFWPG
ncbi:MAG TPA: hypothetical protein VE690_07770 [Rhodopila sp.]|nr:hypothetical protein [Rhodopila sp.]